MERAGAMFLNNEDTAGLRALLLRSGLRRLVEAAFLLVFG